MEEVKYSFVMAYHNRYVQCLNTLRSIEYQYKNRNDFEVVIVDDASNDQNNISNLCDIFNWLKVIKITEDEKGSRLNSCIPYNIGFENSKGSIIIIQNPENIHLGNIINSIEKNIEHELYITFGCYSLTKSQTDHMKSIWNDTFYGFPDNPISTTIRLINPLKNNITNIFENGWYNHSNYRPSEYHFLSAIHKDDLFSIGGFDEEYANGTSFDDNEFLFRIKQKYQTKIIDLPFCLHQWHEHNRDNNPEFLKKHIINENLWRETQRRCSWMPQKSRLL